MAISFILVILGLFIFSISIKDFRRGKENVDQYNIVIALSFFSIIIFALLSVSNIYLVGCIRNIWHLTP